MIIFVYQVAKVISHLLNHHIMKNLFKLKCFDITGPIQEGINEFSNLSGYKRIETQKTITKKPAKKHLALLSAILAFFKI